MTRKEPVRQALLFFCLDIAKTFIFSFTCVILTIKELVIRYYRYSEIMKEKTCCFTGHRHLPPEHLPVILKKLNDTLTTYIRQGYQYFGAGGALGFDTLAAQTVINLKQQYPNIKLILVLPCKDQASRWSPNDVEQYERIKACADKIVYTADRYYNGCMQKRNRHLVDCSSLCICYLTKQSGGTKYTVDYAIANGLSIVNLA